MWQPVRRRSLALEVFEQLRDHIVGGRFAPGDALPAERTLATMLGVNRNAVREGLKRLEQAGLVSIQQGEATKVRDFRRSAGLEILGSMIVRRDGHIDVAVARGVLEMRTEFAPMVGRLAARRSGGTQLEAIDTTVARMMEIHSSDDLSMADVRQLQSEAMTFWGLLVAATENLALQLAFNSLENTYDGVMEHFTHVLAEEVSAVDDYRQLARAVAASQPKKAARLASSIVARGKEAISRVLDAVDEVQR